MSIAEDTGATPALGSVYLPVDITPETMFQELGRLRKEAFDEIERLLQFLDEIDGDTDLEPYLGSGQNGGDDREAEPEHDEDGGDCEASLGLTNSFNQSQSGQPPDRGLDLEEEHDGSEPDVCGEDSLAGLMMINQTRWSEGLSGDREQEHDGREPEMVE